MSADECDKFVIENFETGRMTRISLYVDFLRLSNIIVDPRVSSIAGKLGSRLFS